MPTPNLQASRKTKKTTAGDIPVDWGISKLDHVAVVQTGLAKGKQGIKEPVTMPYLRVANVQDGFFDLSEIKTITVGRSEIARYSIRKNDVLLTEGGDLDKLGRGHLWEGQIEPCLHQNHVFVVRTNPEVLLPVFFALQTAGPHGRNYFLRCAKRTTNLASINSSQLKHFPVILPPLREQHAIASISNALDQVLEQQTKLLAAKLERKRGLMQQLLTGQTRFKEFVTSGKKVKTRYGDFPGDWSQVHIGDIADEAGKKNGGRRELPVLSCTKHRGLVNSLEYFGKRIFSEDTSTYRVVERGDFAYATNHVEEGSIGYQNLHDAALISPMYTVFRTRAGVDHEFFWKLIKTELYRHIFEVNTSGSIARRGALRWDEFALIKVFLPSVPEQQRIAAVLNACDREIELLQKQLEALKEQKRGLMQKLLTGEIRVKG